MVDKKLSELTELTATPATDDEFYIRDVSEVAALESKRITVATLRLAVGYQMRALQVMSGAADMSSSPTLSSPTQVIAGSADMASSPTLDAPATAWS